MEGSTPWQLEWSGEDDELRLWRVLIVTLLSHRELPQRAHDKMLALMENWETPAELAAARPDDLVTTANVKPERIAETLVDVSSRYALWLDDRIPDDPIAPPLPIVERWPGIGPKTIAILAQVETLP